MQADFGFRLKDTYPSACIYPAREIFAAGLMPAGKMFFLGQRKPNIDMLPAS